MKLLHEPLKNHFLKIFSELSLKNTDFFRKKTVLWLDECFFRLLKIKNIEVLIKCGAHEAFASLRFVEETGNRAIAIILEKDKNLPEINI